MLIAFNKPFGVICKFRPEPGRPTLADYIQIPDVYPAGRLDTDSEGLLLLTDDGALQARIANPRHKLAKTYWAQVEGTPTQGEEIPLPLGATFKLGEYVQKLDAKNRLTLPAKFRPHFADGVVEGIIHVLRTWISQMIT